MAVDTLGDELDASFHRIADYYLANAAAIVRLWNSGPRTLIHGDPHIGNLFVDVADGDRTGFLDWGCWAGRPACATSHTCCATRFPERCVPPTSTTGCGATARCSARPV
ncbi:phosphotransferase [Mycobacterium sp.]|uniref:phosphotransferase n=1 Tax=Mycobacterium sp. TaxID=1785 RepID=UPI002C40F886|nr:phosphotransferase [Mycobacterium sp.]HTQ15961.1 phosphotransferase [Mycobacterium sp.]